MDKICGMEQEIPLPPELEVFWRTDDGRTPIERAAAYGIDLSLLEANLLLSPEERMRQNEAACGLVDSLRKARGGE